MNDVVEAIDRLDINSIPKAWRYRITHKSGGIYNAAIDILYYVCTWYRKSEDGGKRFERDKLQLRTRALQEKFHYSGRTVRRALKYLVDEGYITQELRTIELPSGQILNNVRFIEPVPKKIERSLRMPDQETSDQEALEEMAVNPSKLVNESIDQLVEDIPVIGGLTAKHLICIGCLDVFARQLEHERIPEKYQKRVEFFLGPREISELARDQQALEQHPAWKIVHDGFVQSSIEDPARIDLAVISRDLRKGLSDKDLTKSVPAYIQDKVLRVPTPIKTLEQLLSSGPLQATAVLQVIHLFIQHGLSIVAPFVHSPKKLDTAMRYSLQYILISWFIRRRKMNLWAFSRQAGKRLLRDVMQDCIQTMKTDRDFGDDNYEYDMGKVLSLCGRAN